ncbi:hypothetical protein [Thermoactinomyces sp. DSM 45892]|uniref:hypothetical protein n=1 Tax=Thermoactinomyces sp. DSM 45892 TaxID=1882753 RepID=UPI0008953F93|nr:hypothetical protein [Thermoactinomyces sp. DSM 45892]SDY45932.1 hypothetical protein SAMN05444416_1054 [Thermoactinomyces sp. DSM 45892]
MKKILVCGLALSMLMGGAMISSSNVHASSVEEQRVGAETNYSSGDIQPQFWAAIGRGAAKGAAYLAGALAGDAAARAVVGRNVELSSGYDYGQVQEAFDQ